MEKGGQSDVRFVGRRLELAEVRTERRTTPSAAFVFWRYPEVPPRTRERDTIAQEKTAPAETEKKGLGESSGQRA